MALRNYLYAKHDANLDISNRINKVSGPSQPATYQMPSSSSSTTSSSSAAPTAAARRTIPRSTIHNRLHAQDRVFGSQQVNQVTRDLDDFHLEGKECTKSCDSCKCEKEKSRGNEATNGTVSHVGGGGGGGVEPSLKVEVADTEIDFTNVM
ncbi:hypothetical protein CANMA_002780 [Candida margitis]|uniref:uncharacterized protein n=1 Tax=Candida margitis TaxID=1775924 RepID=UPI002226EF88|nr:uncharacterized protein CANMA_002780 [Candida margitis]KAI5968012.1 hypothetical protein CANMA_002780 [Candida margitis]